MNRRTTPLIPCIAAALGLLSFTPLALAQDRITVEQQTGPNPILPEPQLGLFPTMKIAEIIGWSEGETPTVPQGYSIKALATGLEHPRELYTLPNGDILVVESKAPGGKPIRHPKGLVRGWVETWVGGSSDSGDSNRITLLRDANGDGTPEERTVFLDNLNSPFGVALVGSDLYVAHADAIMRYPYNEGDTQITAPGELLAHLPGGPINHHWTKSLVASPDGNLLYVGVGSNSNASERGMEAEKNRAAIHEVDRMSGRQRLYASGLRNPNGLTFNPATGALWTVVNERDELGPNLVPDYLTSVQEGGFYGWPYSYYGQHVDPRVKPERPDLVERALVPDYALGSHVAALGLDFYTGTAFAPRYQGGAFIGLHGSWNRDEFSGYKVIFVPFENGRPSGPAEDFVTGFLNEDGQARGRPVGVAVDATGALLIADDAGNTVWRVTATPPVNASR
ncbi:sorbosone dehydrogenase family protein [Ancylobacter sp. IITR112]|uniref:PQQ-dependent sugar dehydrogenase n=1 Tax=Ancylobacter sp. IITR112 TaxID=3138073 RepID=UPI00352AE32F